MKIISHATALMLVVLCLVLPLAGCSDVSPANPKAVEQSQKDMEDSMKSMTLPKNPQQGSPAGGTATGDSK